MTPEDLALLPRDRAVAVLIRHAERPPVPSGELGNDLTLTTEGRAAAREAGALVAGRLRSLWTSPVRRCRETAELIREGAGIDLAIADDGMLGAPGAFVADETAAARNWEELGNTGVVERLVASDEPLQGMHRPADAARRLHLWLLARLDVTPGFHVFITHDSVLAPFVSRTLNVRTVCWPRWLQLAGTWREGTDVRFTFNGRTWSAGGARMHAEDRLERDGSAAK